MAATKSEMDRQPIHSAVRKIDIVAICLLHGNDQYRLIVAACRCGHKGPVPAGTTECVRLPVAAPRPATVLRFALARICHSWSTIE